MPERHVDSHREKDGGSVARISDSWDIWVLLAVFGFVLLCLAGLYFTQDDTFISLRYARNLADGHGLRFNYGENPPVEGFTNLLWTLLLVIPFSFHFDPLIYTKMLGICSGCFLILTAAVLIYGYTGSRWLTRLGTWILALNVTLCLWSVAGLEMVLFSGIVLAAIYSVPGIFGRGCRVMWVIFWSFLAVLTRPEGIIVVVCIGGILWIRSFKNRQYRRAAIMFTACILLLGCGYAVWKILYFQSVVPNTFYAKVGLDLSNRLKAGYQYIRGWFIHWAWPLVILGMSAFWLKRRDPATWLLTAYICLTLCYICLVGGDFMRYHRFFVPVLGPVTVAAMGGLQAVFSARNRARFSGMVWTVIIPVLLLFTVGYFSSNLVAHYTHFKSFDPSDPLQETSHRDTVLGYWLRTSFSPGTKLAIFNIGRIPYYSNFDTIDTLGLTDPAIAQHLRKSDTCGLAREILSRTPQIVVPQGLGLKHHRKKNWKMFFTGEWKGTRTTTGISPLLNPDSMEYSSLSGCPDVIDMFRSRYEKVRFKLNHFTIVLYIEKELLEEMGGIFPRS
jgi:arabinofuranosyltransferase